MESIKYNFRKNMCEEKRYNSKIKNRLIRNGYKPANNIIYNR